MARRRDRDTRQTAEAPISRRTFIGGVVAVTTAAGAMAGATRTATGGAPAPTAGAAGGARATGDAAALEVLTPEQVRVLAAVLNRLIPADNAMPAAGDAGVAGYIDRVLRDAPHLRRPVSDLLDELHGGGFIQLSAAEQDKRLRRLASDRAESFEILLHAAYTGYYSDPRVLTAADLTAAGSPAPEPFDQTLLDAVRKRGPIYRDV